MFGFAPNFSYKELTHTNTGFYNECTGNKLATLRALSHKLQGLRDCVGKPLYINSAYRSFEVNRAVGGARASHHMYGSAADVSIRNLSSADLDILERAILKSYPCEFIKYDTFWHVAYDFSRLGNSGSIKTWEEEKPECFPPISAETPGDDY